MSSECNLVALSCVHFCNFVHFKLRVVIKEVVISSVKTAAMEEVQRCRPDRECGQLFQSRPKSRRVTETKKQSAVTAFRSQKVSDWPHCPATNSPGHPLRRRARDLWLYKLVSSSRLTEYISRWPVTVPTTHDAAAVAAYTSGTHTRSTIDQH